MAVKAIYVELMEEQLAPCIKEKLEKKLAAVQAELSDIKAQLAECQANSGSDRDNAELNKRIRDLEQENAELRERIKELTSDPKVDKPVNITSLSADGILNYGSDPRTVTLHIRATLDAESDTINSASLSDVEGGNYSSQTIQLNGKDLTTSFIVPLDRVLSAGSKGMTLDLLSNSVVVSSKVFEFVRHPGYSDRFGTPDDVYGAI